jgi:hypothetical protein
LMVFNATFNNISAILWRSALLLEETAGPWIHIGNLVRFALLNAMLPSYSFVYHFVLSFSIALSVS